MQIRALLQTALLVALLHVLSVIAGCTGTRPMDARAEDTDQERANRLARDAIIVDTHIDVPYRVLRSGEDVTQPTAEGQFDLPRAEAGHLDAAFMSIYISAAVDADGEGAVLADQLIDLVDDMVARAPTFTHASCVDDVRWSFERDLVALPMGMENGGPLAEPYRGGDALAHFYDRGVRYVTLAHSRSNALSDSSYDPDERWRGLSPRGKDMVRELNERGVMIDVSHLSDKAFWQVMQLSEAPVIASHSSARHFLPGYERNISDDMIRALAAQGGVVQINFGSSFISQRSREWVFDRDDALDKLIAETGVAPDSPEALAFRREYRERYPYPRASIQDVLDHIEHVIALTGVEHVGLGSDFDGVGDTLPEGLRDVADYPSLVAGLLARGYAEDDIRLILGENLLRVWGRVEDYAAARGNPPRCRHAGTE